MCWGLLSDSLALHSPALGACQHLTASPLQLTTAQSGEEGTGLFKENFTKKKNQKTKNKRGQRLRRVTVCTGLGPLTLPTSQSL